MFLGPRATNIVTVGALSARILNFGHLCVYADDARVRFGSKADISQPRWSVRLC